MKVTAGMPDDEVMRLTGMSISGINEIRAGRTKSIKLAEGLRLCDRANFAPHYLAGVPSPPADMRVEVDGVIFAITAVQASGDLRAGRKLRAKIANAIRAAGLKTDERVSLSEMSRQLPGAGMEPFDLPEPISAALGALETRLRAEIAAESKQTVAGIRKFVAEQFGRPAAPAVRRKQAKTQ